MKYFLNHLPHYSHSPPTISFLRYPNLSYPNRDYLSPNRQLYPLQKSNPPIVFSVFSFQFSGPRSQRTSQPASHSHKKKEKRRKKKKKRAASLHLVPSPFVLILSPLSPSPSLPFLTNQRKPPSRAGKSFFLNMPYKGYVCIIDTVCIFGRFIGEERRGEESCMRCFVRCCCYCCCCCCSYTTFTLVFGSRRRKTTRPTNRFGKKERLLES